MIKEQEIFNIFLHLIFSFAAFCAALYFEVIFFEWYNNSNYSMIGGWIIYPFVGYFGKHFSGNVLLSEFRMHNSLKNTIFIAAGYRIAFIHFDDKQRYILIVTKIIWKIIIYMAFPLGLEGILEKIKKAFYEGGDTKKDVIMGVFFPVNNIYRHNDNSFFFFNSLNI